jgi:pimeloyl-ACP methyl ester carboxylesterase
MIRFLAALLTLPCLAACAATTAASTAAIAPPPQARAAFSSERMAVTVRGEGPDVILIPGLSSSAEVWDSTVAAVPGYRYHIVQVSGFAGRPAGANASGPVVEPVAGEIARYISAAGLQRPAIVGHSLGGAWAMMVAARHPDKVGRVMVVDMLPFLGAMFGGPTATPDSIRPMAEQFRTGIAGGSGAAREAATRQMMATMVRTENMRSVAYRHSMASDPAVSAQAMYDLITNDLRPELGNIRVPLTVLWVNPQGSPVTQEQMAGFYRTSYANAPRARLVHVPNAYHFIMWDEPEFFQREMRAFLTAR